MTAQSRFTIEQHQTASRQLKNIRKRLFNLSSDLSRHYRTKNRCYQAVLFVIQAVDSLRSQLDRQVSREYPEDHTAREIYYKCESLVKKNRNKP